MSYNNDSFFAIFESMNVGIQFSDSSNKANIYPSYIMALLGYGQTFPHSSIGSSSTNEEYGMLTILFLHKCDTTFHIRCKKDFKRAHGRDKGFPSMERLWVGLKKFMHDIFLLIISLIENPCFGMNIIFNNMESFHLTMR